MGTFDEWQAQKDSQYILATKYLENLAKQHNSTIGATANYLIHCDSLNDIYERQSNGEYYPPYHDFNNPPPLIEFLEDAKATYAMNGEWTQSFYFATANLYFKKSELPVIETATPSEPQENTQQIINEVVANADIVKIIGKHVELKRSGLDFKGCCPFHGEKTPSFFVNPKKGIYNCFGCGANGNALTFLTNYEGMNVDEALKELSHQTRIEIPSQSKEIQNKEFLTSEPQAGEIKPLNSIASFITSYNLPQVTALILGISFEYLTVSQNHAYISENDYPYEMVVKFDKLLSSLVASAKSGNLQGVVIASYEPFSFQNPYTPTLPTQPKKELDYLNTVIDKASLESYLKSIGYDLIQLLKLQEPLITTAPQTDNQLSQQVADQQATIDRQAKEITDLKAKIALLEQQAGKVSDTPASEPNYITTPILALNAVVKEFWLQYDPQANNATKQHTIKEWVKENYPEITDSMALWIDKIARHPTAK